MLPDVDLTNVIAFDAQFFRGLGPARDTMWECRLDGVEESHLPNVAASLPQCRW